MIVCQFSLKVTSIIVPVLSLVQESMHFKDIFHLCTKIPSGRKVNYQTPMLKLQLSQQYNKNGFQNALNKTEKAGIIPFILQRLDQILLIQPAFI